MALGASAPTPLPLLPGWWDAAPGSPPQDALYLSVAPRSRAASPEARPRPHDAAFAVAREALRGALAPPVVGPEEAAARASAALGQLRRAPEPLADAVAAALGGLVRAARDESGRPSFRPLAGEAEPALSALSPRLLLWRAPRPLAPGWARRSLARAWLASGGRRPPRAFGAWAEAAAEAATATPERLPEAIARAWLALEDVLAEAPEAAPAREEAARARQAGARAALVDDGGRFVLALAARSGEDCAGNLRAQGIRLMPLQPDPLGLILHA